MADFTKENFDMLKKIVNVWMNDNEAEGGIPIILIFGRKNPKDGTDQFRYCSLATFTPDEVKNILQQILDGWGKNGDPEYRVGKI
jgi:dissimilatory sulfite reductase (desulfoviridin) alpha/beta subunit